MALFLVQHGLSQPKNIDPDPGLSELGIEKTKLIANVAKNYKIPVKQIAHSGKTRAEQTARIFKESLAVNQAIRQVDGIRPMDDVTVFASTIDPDANMMVVGHLPFMGRLVSYLTAGDKNKNVYRFQNSGIVCLDVEDNNWFIKWTLNPDIS
jgi:phosphohistidine phosphatase